MKVALVYDRVNKWGGAERVLLALHAIWPDAPLYTSVYDSTLAPWAKILDVRTSFIQKLPLPKNGHEKYPFLMGLAFESFNLDEYDVVISVTSEFAKAVITKPKTLHLCYCLNPTGYLWSGYEYYFSNRSWGFKKITSPLIRNLRDYDQIVAQRPDNYIAISQTVRKRVQKYYHRESQVVYPSVGEILVDENFKLEETGYYLIVSRLVANKKINIAVKAFNQLKLPLKIVGQGVELNSLKSIAADNIEFLGSLTDAKLGRYYKQCAALVVPAIEDFGIVAVEAQSFGKPVIAFRGGGNEETILEGKTGWFFDRLEPENLAEAISNADLGSINSLNCMQNAEKFSDKVFKHKMESTVNELWEKYQTNV